MTLMLLMVCLDSFIKCLTFEFLNFVCNYPVDSFPLDGGNLRKQHSTIDDDDKTELSFRFPQTWWLCNISHLLRQRE